MAVYCIGCGNNWCTVTIVDQIPPERLKESLQHTVTFSNLLNSTVSIFYWQGLLAQPIPMIRVLACFIGTILCLNFVIDN